MNPLLADHHRRDIIVGDPGDGHLIRLYATAQPDGAVKLVRFRIARIVGIREGQPVFAFSDMDGSRTLDPDRAAHLATGVVRWDGVTTLSIEAVVDSKDTMWKLLAAVEHARRECAEEMGAAFMDRFEYGKEKRRG